MCHQNRSETSPKHYCAPGVVGGGGAQRLDAFGSGFPRSCAASDVREPWEDRPALQRTHEHGARTQAGGDAHVVVKEQAVIVVPVDKGCDATSACQSREGQPRLRAPSCAAVSRFTGPTWTVRPSRFTERRACAEVKPTEATRPRRVRRSGMRMVRSQREPCKGDWSAKQGVRFAQIELPSHSFRPPRNRAPLQGKLRLPATRAAAAAAAASTSRRRLISAFAQQAPPHPTARPPAEQKQQNNAQPPPFRMKNWKRGLGGHKHHSTAGRSL